MKTLIIAGLAFAGGLAVATAASSPSGHLGSAAMTWEQIQNGPAKGKGKAIFRSPTATLEELEMHVTHLPPGEAPHGPHSHVEEELVIVREGTLEALQNGKTQRVGPGGVLFQASRDRHGVRNVGDVPATYYVIRWKSPGPVKPRAPQP